MPRFNPNGEWCSGVAGAGAFWQGGTIWSGAGSAQWLTADDVIAQRWDGGRARVGTHNVRTGAERELYGAGVSIVEGSGHGHWAVQAIDGVHDSFGRHFPGAGLGSMGPDGSYCIKPVYWSGGKWDLLEPDSTRIRLTDGEMAFAFNYGQRCVTWIDGGNPHAYGVPAPAPLTRPFWWMRVHDDWQLYQASDGRMLLHQRGDHNGYVVTTEDTFRPDLFMVGNVARLVWAVREGEHPDDVRVREINLSSPRVDLRPTEPVKPKPIPVSQIEPLVGNWLHSYYEQRGNVPAHQLPPGNAMVCVREQHGPQPRPIILTFETEGEVEGDIIGYRIGSEAQFDGEVVTIEVMEARAQSVHAKGYRPWFYWDSPIVDKIVQHTIPRWPVLPPDSVIELNAFCGAREAIPDYEREMRRYLREAADLPGRYLLALAAQTHTTNDDLQPEPSVMIPPLGRLCQWARAAFGDRFLGINRATP